MADTITPINRDRYLDGRDQPLQGAAAVKAENAFRKLVGLVQYPIEREVILRLERRNVEAKLEAMRRR